MIRHPGAIDERFRQFQEGLERAAHVVLSAFPLTDRTGTKVIEITNTRWDGVSKERMSAISEHKDARLKEKSIAATLLGDVTFKDTVKGIVIDRKFGYKILQVPHITNRESFIVNGNEVQMVNQLRWRPGIYTKIKGDDTVQTTLNTSAAGSYAVILDRTTGVLRLKVGTDKKIPIISVLHALGVTDTEIQSILTDVYKENVKAAHIDKDVFSLFTLLRPYAPVTTPVEEQKSQIVGFLASKPLNPDSTKITTGNRHESITVDAIKDAIRKTLNTSKGVEKEDDIESLAFKDFYTYVDLFLDNLTRNTKLITKDISRRMAVKIHLDNVMPENIFGDRVNDFFATSEFSRYSDQNNPIDVMAVNSAVTLMGSGGIGSTHAVTNDVRQFHPSMIGVIDPVHVPEGCHDFVTQVMTSKGWVNWPEVTENTEFACLDENDILYYSKPHKLFVYDFDGELINFKSQALQFSVTPSHRMWVAPEDNPDSYRMVTAEHLYLKGTGAVWKAPIVHEPLQGDDTEFFEVPPLPEILSGHTTVLPKFNIVDWAEFLGWWLAEGSTYSKPGTYVVRVSQDLAANPEKCARIVRLLDRMGVVYNFSSERAFTISSKQLYTYLEQFGRQHFRYIPEDAFTWPLAARRAMFEAMMLGDGSGLNRTSGPLRYSSTSKRLSEDLSRLAFTLGLSSVVCHETDGRKTHYKDNYPVIIHKHHVRNLTGRFRDKSSGMVKQPYTGKVYCASVPGERLYCRKNGKGGFWSGNSSIGTTLHTTITAAHQDKRLYVRVINAKTGEVEQIPVEELMSKVVGFADQYDLSKEGVAPKALYAKVKARHNTDFLEVDPSTVEYIFSRGSNMFSTSTNLIPFLNNNSPNRQLMANKHIEQTVQLVNPDRPIVQTSLPNGATYHETLADIINPSSPVDGTVQHVSKDKIVIEDAEGKTHVVELYDDYPLKSKTLLNDESIVKRGQKVKKGQVIARNTFTKDGALSLGKNLRIAFMPWKGVNIEDGIVISDTAAKKLTSLHKHEFRVEKDDQVRVDLQLYLAQFPHQYEAVRERDKRYTADGLIKRGAKVVKGDLLIPALRLLNLSGSSLTNLHKKSLSTSYQDAGETWEKDVPGEVIDVVTTRNFVKVLVKSQEPLIVGDKLSFAASGKGIVIQILNDAEMPRNKKGDPMEVLFSTPGVISRLNPGILYEPLIGKALHKTKETYKVQNFDRNTESDTLSEVEAILKKHHVKDTDDLYDPTTGKTIPGVLNGVIHTLKLKHQVDTKISARGAGGGLPYTSLGSPKKESGESAQRVGFLDTFSLLSGGSKEVLKDMFGVKSTRNDEYWTALQLGLPLPQPKVPYVTEKLLVDLMGAGINLNQQGSKISLSPLTDKEILKISGGEIKNPDTVRAKDMGEISGGLFDMYATGGVTGQRFSHYKLAKPVLNPLMYTAVVSVGNFPTAKVMDEIMEGKRGVAPNGDILDGPGGVTGVEGVIIRLKSINVEEELKKNSQQAPLLKGTEKNKAYKRIQFLDSLKRLGLHPEEAYVNNYMAIIPPKFRKISELPDGTVSVSDPNHGYRQVMLISEKLKELQTLGVGKEHTRELESALQTAMDKHVGMVPGDKNDREFRGFIEAINGRNESKYGFLKREVLNRQQDLSARSTIIVNPKFGLDEVGLPKSMAMTIYKPFVVKGLIASGYSPVESKKLVEDGDRRAFDVLRKEMETRPVLINRAPSLHKFSIIAQRPVLVDGKAIEVNQLIMPGLNADLDGDQQNGRVYFSIKNNVLDTVKGILVQNIDFCLENGISADYSIVGREKALQQYLSDRLMTSRTRVSTLYRKNAQVFCCDLADFPRLDAIDEISVGSQGNLIRWHTVPEGIEVLAHNPDSGHLEWKAATKWSMHVDCPVEIVHTSSGHVLYTDNDPRAVYGISMYSEDFSPSRMRPGEALKCKMSVPYATGVDLPEDTNYCSENMAYAMGALIGDGWASAHKGKFKDVCLSNVDDSVVAKVDAGLREWTGTEAKLGHRKSASEDSPHAPYGTSRTFVWASVDSASIVANAIGTGSINKHLPDFAFTLPKSRAAAMLAGLMDTDGSIGVTKAISKNKPQTYCNYSTTSFRLAREVVLLCKKLNVRAGITKTRTPKGTDAWAVSIQAAGLKAAGVANYLQISEKKLALERVEDIVDSAVNARYDSVPLPIPTAKKLIKLLKPVSKTLTKLGYANMPDSAKEHASLYSILAKQAGKNATNTISRSVAKKLIDKLDGQFLGDPALLKWTAIVNNHSIRWGAVTSVDVTGIAETGYDLTVPGFETFTTVDGIVLSNTVGVHVPVTEAARKEAVEKLMASKYIINPRSGDIEAHPNIDAVFGVYKMTTPVGTPTKHFLNKDELITAYRSGAVEINEAVTVGDQVHCAGQFLANEMVPESNRVGPIQLNAKKQSQVLLDVARTQPSQVAAETLNKFKDAGFEHITNLGFSVSLNDLKVDKKQRDIIFNKMDERTKEVGFDIAATEATKELEKLLAASLDNNLVQATFISGASGKSGAVRQLIGAPVAIVDPKGKVVPFAIKKSYAEGHDTGTYLAGIGGSRQGLIDKGLTVADSGYLSRLLVSSNLENIISIDDCHTSQGKDVSINDPDIHDRYGAEGAYRNMLLTPSVVQKIRSSGVTVIKVRSPLTCQATSGVCAMCFGVLENGKRPEVGYHIGAVAAQALGERSTQMTLSAFHSGSAIGGTRVGLPRLKELLHNTEVSKGNAVLSSETGSVTNVVDAPAGGKFVYINKAKHFVPQELGVAVAQGSHVSAGDKLSVHGSIRPRDILETTGDMSRTQDVLVQELLASYGKTKFNKRIVETAVKPMTDRAQITNAGDGDRLFGVHPGEVYVKAQLDNYNIELRNKGMKQIIYTPMLLGITQIPHHSDDVVASLAHERIKEHLQKAPAIGREIDYGAGGHVLSRLGLQHFDSIDRLKRGG